MERAPRLHSESEYTYEPYDRQGKMYVKAQREFYSDTPDTGRVFFKDALEANIRGKTLVDMGCGAGDDLIAYKQMGAGRVIGIEPSKVMFEAAQETIRKSELPIELLQGEWSHIPLKDNSADIVTARYSFHIISRIDKAYEEVSRVLKEGGQFILAVPHPQYDAKLVKEQGLQQGARIKSSLFGGKIVVDNASHTMEDYLSGIALKYFVVDGKLEYSMGENAKEADPTGLVLNFRKKSNARDASFG